MSTEGAALTTYKGLLRITVFLKDDYDRAVRVVVNPATDTWRTFTKDVLTKLRMRIDTFLLVRSATKAIVKSVQELRQNDILCLQPQAVDIDDSPLTDSPLSVARVKHLKLESVGPTNQFGPTFVCTCSKRGKTVLGFSCGAAARWVTVIPTLLLVCAQAWTTPMRRTHCAWNLKWSILQNTRTFVSMRSCQRFHRTPTSRVSGRGSRSLTCHPAS